MGGNMGANGKPRLALGRGLGSLFAELNSIAAENGVEVNILDEATGVTDIDIRLLNQIDGELTEDMLTDGILSKAEELKNEK